MLHFEITADQNTVLKTSNMQSSESTGSRMQRATVTDRFTVTATKSIDSQHELIRLDSGAEWVVFRRHFLGWPIAAMPHATNQPKAGLSIVTAIVNTTLKGDWRYQSKDLPPDQVAPFPINDSIECVITKAPNQNGHILITLPGDQPIAGKNTWYVFENHVEIVTPGGLSSGPGERITRADIEQAALELGITPQIMRAVIEVEAAGSGFFPSGRPKILLEAHWFSHFTDGAYDQSHPQISSARWNRDLYKGGEAEWDRLNAAVKLDEIAAYQSASYGLGQIMGFHWQPLAYESVLAFVDCMAKSEGEQLLAMARFIKADRRLVRALQAKDWAGFAEIYNGPGFMLNQYDKKLADAYRDVA